MKLRLPHLFTFLACLLPLQLSAKTLSLSPMPAKEIFSQTSPNEQISNSLPALTDLQADARQADGRFTMILVSQPDCRYCEIIMDEVLLPMQKSGHYMKKLQFRKLTIFGDETPITDFNGNQVSPTEFAKRYNAAFSPTLLFVDPNDGKVLADKMVGIKTVDLYGFYLNRTVKKAGKALRYKKMLAAK